MASEPVKVYDVTEPYLHYQCQLGEGPYYDEPNNMLRFTAPYEQSMHFVDLSNGPQSHKVVESTGLSVGVTANIEGNTTHFAFAGSEGFGVWDLTTSKHHHIKEPWNEAEKAAGGTEKWTMNDGAVDAKGNFWAGIMSRDAPNTPEKAEGRLVRLDCTTLEVSTMLDSLAVSNGMSWSLDNKTMYHTDTFQYCVHAYDHDTETGKLSNKRVFWAPTADDIADGISAPMKAAPDGHCIDVEGHIWVALFFGGRVVRISPEGKKVAEIRLPSRCVTCPAFGGKDFDELYITTARDWVPDTANEAQLKYQGYTFKCKVGVKGRRPNLFKLDKAKTLLRATEDN